MEYMRYSGLQAVVSVLLAVVIVLAGCTAGLSGSTSTSTPHGTVPPKPNPTVTPIAFPERPANFTAENVVNFTVEFEKAVVSHRAWTPNTTEFSIVIKEARLMNRTDDEYVVHLEASSGQAKLVFVNGEWQEGEGHGIYTANYLINESVIRRIQTGGRPDPGPDPRYGEVVKEY